MKSYSPNFSTSNDCMIDLFQKYSSCNYDPCKVVQCVKSLNNKKSDQTYNVDFFKTQCPHLNWKKSCPL